MTCGYVTGCSRCLRLPWQPMSYHEYEYAKVGAVGQASQILVVANTLIEGELCMILDGSCWLIPS